MSVGKYWLVTVWSITQDGSRSHSHLEDGELQDVRERYIEHMDPETDCLSIVQLIPDEQSTVVVWYDSVEDRWSLTEQR